MIKVKDFYTALEAAITLAEINALELPTREQAQPKAMRKQVFKLSKTAGNPVYALPDDVADYIGFALGNDITRHRTQTLCVEVKAETIVATDGFRLHMAPAPGIPDGVYFIDDNEGKIVAAINYDSETDEVLEAPRFPAWETVVPQKEFLTPVAIDFIRPDVESVFLSIDSDGTLAYYGGGYMATMANTDHVADALPGGSGTLLLPYEYPAPFMVECGPYSAVIMPLSDSQNQGAIPHRKVHPGLSGKEARRNGFMASLQSLAAIMCLYVTDLSGMEHDDQIAWLLENVEFPTPDPYLMAGFYYTNSYNMASSLTVDLIQQRMELGNAITRRVDDAIAG